jgi:multidrug resistance efflux pump
VERLREKVTNLEAQLAGQRLEEQRTKAEADNARIAFENARKAFDRQAMLYKEGATARLTYERSQKEFTNTQVEYDARASLARQASERLLSLNKSLEDTRKTLLEQSSEWEEAKNDLNATEIHSPAAGIVIKVNKQNGDAITTEEKEIFHIAVDLTAMEVIVEFAPAEVQRVKPGMKAVITLVEAGNAPIEGVLKEIRETTGYIEFVSPSQAIVPGLIAQVKIQLKELAPMEPTAPVESKKKN